MRKIINGKVYDTETAKRIAEWENMASVSDLNYVCETLYRKRNGEYFVHGEGGAMSAYAVGAGASSWVGGESIRPVDYEYARQWMEERGSSDAYEREFGVVDDDGESVRLHIRIAASTKAKLDRYAAKNSMTLGEAIESLVSGA